MDELVIDGPVGPMRLRSSDDGESLASVVFADGAAPVGSRSGVLGRAADQLDAYFAGGLREFDLPLDAAGSPFQQAVWAQLCEIPFARTATYGEIAGRLRMAPGASRAVGLANGSNPISVIVPCHRVIGADGTLTGYGGGLPRKRFLLDLEQRVDGQQLF